jgi:hypothetical protein
MMFGVVDIVVVDVVVVGSQLHMAKREVATMDGFPLPARSVFTL